MMLQYAVPEFFFPVGVNEMCVTDEKEKDERKKGKIIMNMIMK